PCWGCKRLRCTDRHRRTRSARPPHTCLRYSAPAGKALGSGNPRRTNIGRAEARRSLPRARAPNDFRTLNSKPRRAARARRARSTWSSAYTVAFYVDGRADQTGGTGVGAERIAQLQAARARERAHHTQRTGAAPAEAAAA